eukprot:snap_masked-scaffold_91-processed-gene-0.36-mRNA-1 protein AED:1.00 eAED:1.00 QI:0/-1/0/0/-1/1/1/0/232
MYSKKESLVAKSLTDSLIPDVITKDIVLGFILRGQDTSLGGISWLIYELGMHPEIQDELYRRIKEKMDTKENPSMEDIDPKNFPYLNGVVFETLRLHPPIPKIARAATKNVRYFDGKKEIVIPKGTKIKISAFVILRNPLNFPEPMKFKPERWVPLKEMSPFEFPVFSAGHRSCTGKDFYLREARLFLLMVFRKFRLVLVDKKPRYSVGFIPIPAVNSGGTKHELCMDIISR